MSKVKAQGTAFETQIVQQAKSQGWQAERLAEGGSHDMGDVYLGKRPVTVKPIVMLAWKRLVPKPGATRRQPDGEPIVFVLDQATAWYAIQLMQEDGLRPIVIECKATERLNVTRVLAKAKGKIDKWWATNRIV